MTRILLILFLSTGLSSISHAKEYLIPEIRVEVQINADGSLRITEHRTYVFDGSYSWANYRLPLTGFDEFSDIRVAEGSRDFINLDNEEPGSFETSRSSRALDIKWFFDASDEERTFSVSYTLKGAVTTGPDWSQFFWNYAASGRERSQEQFSIRITLPETVSPNDLHSWIRNPSGERMRTSLLNDGYLFSIDDISRGQAIVIRTVFPTEVFAEDIRITNPTFSLQWAADDENRYQEERILRIAEEEKLLSYGIQIAVFLSGLSLLSFIYFYRRYGIRHSVQGVPKESLLIPGRQKPAVIGWLLSSRYTTAGHVMATLMDLARQGYFRIEEKEPKEEKTWYNDPKPYYAIYTEDQPIDDRLSEWEINFIQFLRNRIDEAGHDMKEIFKYSEREVSKWFSDWKKQVNEHAKEKQWYDEKSTKGAWYSGGVQALILFAGAVAIFAVHPVSGLSMITGILFLGLSAIITRRTPKGEETYQKWMSYKKGLANAGEHSISEDHIERHFIYSVAFGLTKDQMEHLFEDHTTTMLTIYWLVILPGSNNSPADIAGSFSSFAATGTASAAGGAGMGASAGAAGGGASGGVG